MSKIGLGKLIRSYPITNTRKNKGNNMISSFKQIVDEFATQVNNEGEGLVKITTINGQTTIYINQHSIKGADTPLVAFDMVTELIINSERPEGIEFSFEILNQSELDMEAIHANKSPNGTLELQVKRVTVPRRVKMQVELH